MTNPQQKYDGEFRPPRMGNRHMPIGIAGRGSIELRPTEMVARGFKTSDRSGLIALLFFGGFAAFIIFAVNLGLSEGIRNILVLVLVPTFIGFVLKGRGKTKEDKPLTLNIPWESVRKVELNDAEVDAGDPADELTTEVTILVKKHKPKGMLHFYPEGSAEELVEALNAATPRPSTP